jgi:hypothetical protein
MASPEFQTGDAVRITCNGRAVPGSVLLASGNGRSLMLGFEALIEGHVGMMPVSRNEQGVYQSIVTGVTVELKREGAL